MAELKVSGITFTYEEAPVLEDVNIELHEHELVSILGASGCGKTTLFHIISGLHKPQQGKVTLNGKDITGCPGQISYMMQKDLLLSYRTIEDNVSLPLVLKGESKRKAREKVARSTAITRSMPEKANSADASTGCRIVLREPERDRRPLVRW